MTANRALSAASGILGASVGAIGTAMAQQHLRNILAYLDVPTLGQPEAFIQAKDGLLDENGNFAGSSKQFYQAWMDHYVGWVKQHARASTNGTEVPAMARGPEIVK